MIIREIPLTSAIPVVLLSFYLLGLADTSSKDHFLSLSASNVIMSHIRPWVYVSAGFYEPTISRLIICSLLSVQVGSKIERQLTSLALLRIIILVNVISMFIIFVNVFAMYILFRDPDILTMQFSGFYGALMAMIVAYAKLNPEKHIGLLGIQKVPLMVVTALSIVALGMVLMFNNWTMVTITSLSILGFYIGWYYLRFLQVHVDGSKGDISDAFELANFAAPCCHGCITSLGNFALGVGKLCGFFQSRNAQTNLLPIVIQENDAVSERRRARAKKALDEKLARIAAKTNAPHEGEVPKN